jgi:adenosylhomocysteine nucleosidase
MVFHIRTLIDLASGQVFELENDWRKHGLTADREFMPTLVTVDRVVSIAEKQKLREHYDADLVDMEAAAVAKMALLRRIPFQAIKGVSDEHDFDLPDMHQFVTPDGGFRERSFALYVALRPTFWRTLARMARGSSLAARNLCRELQQCIDADEAGK